MTPDTEAADRIAADGARVGVLGQRGEEDLAQVARGAYDGVDLVEARAGAVGLRMEPESVAPKDIVSVPRFTEPVVRRRCATTIRN